jgi:hypothetical protein
MKTGWLFIGVDQRRVEFSAGSSSLIQELHGEGAWLRVGWLQVAGRKGDREFGRVVTDLQNSYKALLTCGEGL